MKISNQYIINSIQKNMETKNATTNPTTQMNTTELTRLINLEMEIPISAFKEYTPEEISRATYIHINPKDATWRLGFGDPKELDPLDLECFLDYSDLQLPIYIY